MNLNFLRKGINLFSIFGIRISLNYSWFIIFGLVVYSLAEGYFRITQPYMTRLSNWVAALITTILLFASVLFHELSHSLLAKANGITVKGISLFILGGLAHIEEEPSEAKTEFKIAIAGPASSLFLAAVFLIYFIVFKVIFELSLIGSIFYHLFIINTILALFNLIPGFPLDGGRILRAYLWHRTKDHNKATIAASRVGKWFAIGLMSLGFYSIITEHILNGFWLVFIGIFLHQAAYQSSRLASINQALVGTKVKDIIAFNVMNTNQDANIKNLVNKYFLKYRTTTIPIVDNKHFLGMISLDDVKNIPRREWEIKKINDIAPSRNDKDIIHPEEDAATALKKMLTLGKSSLAAVNAEGEFIGLITRRDIMDIFNIKSKLNAKSS